MFKINTKNIPIYFLCICGALILGLLINKLYLNENTEEATESIDRHLSVNTKINNKEDKVVLTLWHPNALEVNYNSYILNAFEEELDVEIKFETLPDNGIQYMNMKIASGEIPDMFKDLSFTEYNNYIDEGIFAVIPIDLMKIYSPKLIDWFITNTSDEEYIWDYYLRNGRNYAVPSLWTIASNALGIGYRKDWLEDVGIDKEPETLEELEVAFELIKQQKGTYAISGIDIRYFDFVFGAFDSYPKIFVERDGRIIRGEIEPGAKEALTVLNRWYMNGYIDPEFIINKEENLKEKWIEEDYGFLQYFWWSFLSRDTFYSQSYKDMIEDINPQAEVDVMVPPKGPSGYSGTVQINPILPGVQFGRQLNKDHDKLIKYLQLFDLAFDYNAIELLYKGVEGITYTYSPREGYKFIPPYTTHEKKVEFGIWLPLLEDFNDYDLQYNLNTLPQNRPIYEQYKEKMADTGEYDILAPVYKPIYNAKNEYLVNMVDRNFIKFIIGERPLEEFDLFVEEWYEAGGLEIMEEVKQRYEQHH